LAQINYKERKMANKKICMGILVMVLVFGMTAVGCNNGSTDGGGSLTGGGGGQWREKKFIFYSVTDGVASPSTEFVYNYITYRYTSDTNYEIKYTLTSPNINLATTTHITRNGQTLVEEENGLADTTSTSTYDSTTGLELTRTTTSTSTQLSSLSPMTVEYNIQLLDDSDGVKTYKHSTKTVTIDGNSIDISDNSSVLGGLASIYLEYIVYKIKNGKIFEAKQYSADGGVSALGITYVFSDDAVIRAKLGDGFYTSGFGYYGTIEVLSDSATELVIRFKGFDNNNKLTNQNDYYYEKVN